jgi:high frequency lysogenization protein
MSDSLTNRTLALAGVFQSAWLVQQVATTGRCDESMLETCINSIFNIKPDNAEAIYGSSLCLSKGLSLVATNFEGTPDQRNLDVTKYVLSLLYLERKLAKRPDLLHSISEGIERAKTQLMHFPQTHPNILASIANTYEHTISTLTPRIIVSGEHGYLTNPDIANKVRAILLGGVRSAVLWSQCGGNRFGLLFGRRKLVEESKRIYKSLNI